MDFLLDLMTFMTLVFRFNMLLNYVLYTIKGKLLSVDIETSLSVFVSLILPTNSVLDKLCMTSLQSNA